MTRIPFPALLPLLHSSRNIVDIHLHEAVKSWCLSVEELTDALSGMAQLRSLSLHFSPATNYVSPSRVLPADHHFVLPSLTHLIYGGTANHLGRLVLRINVPRLRDIQVTLFDKSPFDPSRLFKFTDQIKRHESPHRAHILSSERGISISLKLAQLDPQSNTSHDIT